MTGNPLFVFAGGQMTDLPPFTLTDFVGSELMEIVSPADPADALNYAITTLQLAFLLGAFVYQPTEVVVGTVYNVLPSDTRILVKKTIGSATSIVFGLSQAQPLPVLVKDLKGDADVNPITITFTGGQLADGLSTVTINTPYGGYWINPLAEGGWYLGTG